MKIVVLAGGILAIPSLQQLAQSQLLAGIVLPTPAHDGTEQIKTMFGPTGIPILEVGASDMNAPLGNWLQQINPDVVYVLTFNYKVPNKVMQQVPHGFFNFHFAILPQYRGPQPLFWQIRNKEPFGGISVHRMTDKMDEGDLALIEKVAIQPNDTYGMHQIRLAYAGPQAVGKLTMALVNNTLTLTPQDASKAHYYPRPQYEDLIIQWEQHDSENIIALLHAVNPWNRGAFTMINGMQLKIISATITDYPQHEVAPGTLVATGAPGTFVQCCDGKVLRIDITYSEEGYFTGEQLTALGIQPPLRFT